MSELHQVTTRQGYDRYLAFGTLFVGVLGTFLLKYFEAPVLVQVIFPGVVLLAYAALAHWSERLSVEPEIAGDNCYYFGFIFTLVSMAYTLYGIHQIADDLDLVSSIVAGFGVALTSTIFGIALRVVFLQLRPDMVQSEREARHALSTSVNEFKSEMSTCVKLLNSFQTESAQQMTEYKENLFNQNKDGTVEYAKWLNDHLRTTGEAQLKQFDKLGDDYITLLRDSLGEATEALSSNSEKLSGAVGDLVKHIETEASSAGSKLSEANQMLDAQIEKVVQTNEHQETAFRKSLDACVDVWGQTNSRVASTLNQHADDIAKASQQFTESVNEATLALQQSLPRPMPARPPSPLEEERPRRAPPVPSAPETRDSAFGRFLGRNRK